MYRVGARVDHLLDLADHLTHLVGSDHTDEDAAQNPITPKGRNPSSNDMTSVLSSPSVIPISSAACDGTRHVSGTDLEAEPSVDAHLFLPSLSSLSCLPPLRGDGGQPGSKVGDIGAGVQG